MGTRQRPSRPRPGRQHYPSLATDPAQWSRRQAQTVVALLVLAGVLVTLGAVLTVVHTTTGSDRRGGPGSTSASTLPVPPARAEDEIAGAPFPSAAPELARPGELSTETHEAVVIPAATTLGPAGVPTGFPQTIQGAVAQLAAIDRVALESASIPRTQDIIRNWASTGGPTDQTWSGVQATVTLLSAAGLPADATADLQINVTPAMALVKGHLPAANPGYNRGDTPGEDRDSSRAPTPAPDAPAIPGTSPTSTVAASDQEAVEFVVPCLQLVVTAELGERTHRTAVSDCQRMAWDNDRWVIAAGAEPAPAPSLWPGTALAYELGFRWIETDQ